MNVNYFGATRIVKEFLPLLIRGSRIVNISSVSGGIWNAPFHGAYAASKAALEAFSDSLRSEVQPKGVSVSIIQPGAINTKIWVKAQKTVVLKSKSRFLANYSTAGHGGMSSVETVVDAIHHGS
ncbi:hypothetical protein HK096_005602, partial [Nowakowskiella sp. JEL0078]